MDNQCPITSIQHGTGIALDAQPQTTPTQTGFTRYSGALAKDEPTVKKTILLLGAGSEQIVAIKQAKALGYRVVAADANPDAVGLRLADAYYVRDIRKHNEVYDIAVRENINGIFVHAVELAEVVAYTAHIRDLPGCDPRAAKTASDKFLRYLALQNKNVPHPRFGWARHIDDIYKEIDFLGLPVVVKPSDNAGARGVTLLTAKENAAWAFEEAMKFSRNGRLLIEEYVEGPQISTEHVVYKDKIYTTGFADRHYDKDFKPYLIEDGHTIPSLLSKNEQLSVIATAEAAIRAIGINWGPAKGDIVLGMHGPVVLEMAARTSGGRFCSDMVPLATGVSILKPLLQMAVGDTPDAEDFEPKFARAASQRFMLPKPGRVVVIDGLEETRKMGEVYDVVCNIKVGDIVEPLTSHAKRVGHVIATGRTRESAALRAVEAVARVKIEVE